ncbi:MAG: hypothetical protein RR446_00685 [Lachnospiraceae bacterium]
MARCWIKVIVFLIVCIGISEGCKFALIPSSTTRLNLHNIRENKYDDVFLGTSHGQVGINPMVVDRVTGRKSTSLCLASEFPVDSYYLIKELERYQKPKRLIYELDPGYWVVPQGRGKNEVFIYNELGLSVNKLSYGWNKYRKTDFRTALFPWYYHRNRLGRVKENLQIKTSKEYQNYSPSTVGNVAEQYYRGEGFLYHKRQANEDKGGLNIVLWDRKKVKKDREQYFHKIVEYCKKEGIELVAVILPISQETLEHYSDIYQDADQYFKEITTKYKIPYRNFNNVEDVGIDRSMNSYYDYDGHMYGDAAEKFGEVLGEYLKK